jgi:hypothetical protein
MAGRQWEAHEALLMNGYIISQALALTPVRKYITCRFSTSPLAIISIF